MGSGWPRAFRVGARSAFSGVGSGCGGGTRCSGRNYPQAFHAVRASNERLVHSDHESNRPRRAPRTRILTTARYSCLTNWDSGATRLDGFSTISKAKALGCLGSDTGMNSSN